MGGGEELGGPQCGPVPGQAGWTSERGGRHRPLESDRQPGGANFADGRGRTPGTWRRAGAALPGGPAASAHGRAWAPL